MDDLTKFIKDTAGEEWVMGHADCGPWLLRWVSSQIGRTTDMLEYSTNEEAMKLIKAAGNFGTLVGRFCAELGLEYTGNPMRGDIGVIDHKSSLSGQTVAICLGGGKWAVRVHHGDNAANTTVKAYPKVAWKVGP